MTDGSGDARPLPVALGQSSSFGLVAGDGGHAGADGVSRGAEAMLGDVCHGDGLACGERRKPRGIGETAAGGVGLEGHLVRVAHSHLSANPCAAHLDGLAGPRIVALLLEEREHVLGTEKRPLGDQAVMLVRESAAAPNGDQSRVSFLGKDGHAAILF